MKQRGEQLIDNKECLTKQVKLEFITSEKKSINLRAEFSNIFRKMKSVDTTLKIIGKDTIQEWCMPEDLPVNETFMEAFGVKQVNQQRRAPAVIMYFKTKSVMKLNTINYNPTVWAQVGLPGTYMKVDHFERDQTACPGFLIQVHPKMVWKENLVKEIQQAVKTVKVPVNNKIVTRWKSNHPKKDAHPSMPFLTLQPELRKMKGSQVEVLNVISAQRDAELLKCYYQRQEKLKRERDGYLFQLDFT